jgi:glyoxylase-like metal-dependent hydrolase (beta-lactamase superfamily II)
MTISRRGFLGSAAAFTTGAIVAPRMVFAQQIQLPQIVVQGRAAGASAKITTKNLRGNVFVLMGSGGNIAVLSGKDGKLLVDSGYATSQPQILEALNGISADPVKHLVNTHWHFDHTDGNEWMHSAGATIMAQAKCKERLSTSQQIAAFGATFPPAPAGAIPTMTFGEKYKTRLNNVTMDLEHYAPAHTDTDISVMFADVDVFHAGDTFFNGFYPFIDYSSNGNIDGMIRAAKRSLSQIGSNTIVIPGHGQVGDKAQLQAYYDMLVTVRGTIGALKQQGKTLAEVVAAKPTADLDVTWGAGFMKPEVFLGLVYQGV